MVKVVVTCKHEVRRVTIEDALLARRQGDARGLIAAAFNDANRKVEQHSAAEDGVGHRRLGVAGRPQAAVLSDRARRLFAASEPADPGVAMPARASARRSAQRMAFHLLDKDREGAGRLAATLEQRSARDPQLRALPNADRGADLPVLRQREARRADSYASSRRRRTCWRSSSPAPTAGATSC